MEKHEAECPESWTEGTKPWYEKGYAAWDWVTSTRVVCAVPCELVYATFCTGVAASAAIYNGVSTTGNIVAILQSSIGMVSPLAPPEPILCTKGIYVVLTAAENRGVLIMWRPLPTGWRP